LLQNHFRDLRPGYDHLLRNLKAAQAVIASQSATFRRCYGKEFTDRLFGLRKRAESGKHEFDRLCTAFDIEHRLTQPRSPQTNGMVERFNGRIEDVLQNHHFRSGEELEATLHRYTWLYNQQLPQSALGSRTPLQAMKDWHNLKLEIFKKQSYYRPGCDS
jgi:transposase InsO family protein